MDHNEAKIIDLQKGLVMTRGREGSVSANVNSFAIIHRVYIQQASPRLGLYQCVARRITTFIFSRIIYYIESIVIIKQI